MTLLLINWIVLGAVEKRDSQKSFREKRNMSKSFFSMFALLGVLVGSFAEAADWPTWRGTARDGISKETGLLQSWPAGGPEKVWTFNNDANASMETSALGPDGTIYYASSDHKIYAVDGQTGVKKWEQSIPLYTNHGNPKLLSIANGILCACFNGYLYGFNAQTGKMKWEYTQLIGVSNLAIGNNGLIYISGHSANRVHAINAAD